MGCGFGFVIGDDEDAEAHWEEGECSVSRDGFLVKEEIDEGDHGGEEYTGDLVKCDGRVGQGEILEDDVQAHGRGEREHWPEAYRVRNEEGNEGSRKDVKGESGDEEMKGGEGDLRVTKRRIIEDSLVGEDLKRIQLQKNILHGGGQTYNGDSSDGVEGHPHSQPCSCVGGLILGTRAIGNLFF